MVDAAFMVAALCLAATVAIAIWSALRPKAFAAISARGIAVDQTMGEIFYDIPGDGRGVAWLWRKVRTLFSGRASGR